MINEMVKDLADDDLPKDLKAFDKIKCPMTSGAKIHWYHTEDKELAEKDGFNARENAGYEGIIVPAPDVELRGGTIEAEECVVVMTSYPCEKCYPESTWFALKRLLNDETLVEIFSPDNVELTHGGREASDCKPKP